MAGRANEGRGRALEGDRGEPMGKGPEASGDFLPAVLTPSNFREFAPAYLPELTIAPQWGACPRRAADSRPDALPTGVNVERATRHIRRPKDGEVRKATRPL